MADTALTPRRRRADIPDDLRLLERASDEEIGYTLILQGLALLTPERRRDLATRAILELAEPGVAETLVTALGL